MRSDGLLFTVVAWLRQSEPGALACVSAFRLGIRYRQRTAPAFQKTKAAEGAVSELRRRSVQLTDRRATSLLPDKRPFPTPPGSRKRRKTKSERENQGERWVGSLVGGGGDFGWSRARRSQQWPTR